MTTLKMPTRWSYSSLKTYEKCPAAWRYSYMLGLKGEESSAMIRGSRLHADCENYLKGDFTVVPWELTKVGKALDEMKQRGAKSEETWLLNREWEPVNDPAEAWIKSIVDVHWVEGNILQIIDFKSGKEYPEHRDQLELYGLSGLRMYPEVKRAEFKALYLDSNHTSNEGAVIRDMLPYKQEAWTGRAIKIWEDKDFKATPSAKACRFCNYNQKKDGPCREGV
jgi:hypothetical protein